MNSTTFVASRPIARARKRWLAAALGSLWSLSAVAGDGSVPSFFGPHELARNDGQVESDKNASQIKAPIARPIIYATGNLVQRETDFVSHEAEMPLTLVRTYNNYWSGIGIFGKQWQSNLDYKLSFVTSQSSDACYPKPGVASCATPPAAPSVIWAHRPDGRRIKFNWDAASSSWLESKPQAVAKIIKNGDGTYTLTSEDNTTERYTNSGFVASIKDAAGVGWTFTYSNNYLQRVTHTSGRYMALTWTGTQLTSVTDPAGGVHNYTYLANRFGSNLHLLSSSTRPGVATTTISYHYEDSRYPGGLTGRSFNGVRYSTLAYDSNGRALSFSPAGDVNVSYGGFAQMLATTVTNALGKIETYQFHAGKLVSVTGEASTYSADTFRSRTYDVNGYEDLVTDNNGNAVDFDYSAEGRLLQRIDAAGTASARTTQYTWDAAKNRITKATVVGVSETSYAFTTDNRLASIAVRNLVAGSTNFNQVRTATYSYTKLANGLLSAMTVDGPIPGTGDAVTYNFNATGDLVSVVDALGTVATYSLHNGFGQPGRIVSRTGVVTDLVYDAQGRELTSTRTVDGVAATTTSAYDAAGMLSYRITPDGVRTDFAHDDNHRLTSVQRDPHAMVAGNATAEGVGLVYDAAGDGTRANEWAISGHYERVFSCLYPAGASPAQCVEPDYNRVWVVDKTTSRSVLNDYDELGRPRAERGNAGQNVRYAYDANGNVKSITDSLNRVTQLVYDAQNRLVTATDPLNGVSKLSYNVAGQVASMTDPRGLVTTYAYDGFGQLWTQVSPDTGTTSYVYDAYGRLTGFTRAAGTANAATTTLVYDTLGRVTSITAGGRTQTFAYDACTNGKARLCAVTDPSGSTAYTYTVTGQVATQTNTIGGTAYTTAFQYDAMDRTTAITYPDGKVVNYAYSYGRLSSVTATINGVTSTVVGSIQYQPLGPAASWSFGNGLPRKLTYDLDGRLDAITTSPTTQSLGFDHTANDDISVLTNDANPSLTQNYAYDALYRMTSAQSGAVTESFGYDAVGNRVTHVVNGATRTSTMAVSSNRLLSVAGGGVNRTFTYDAFGNRISEAGTNGTFAWSYDPFNRLASATKNGVTTTYAVNALGQRVSKQTGSAVTRFIYGPDGTLLAELNGSAWTDYVRMGGDAVGMIRGNALYFIHNDQLGRPEAVTSSLQTVVWRANNAAFDRTVTTDTIGGLNLGFPGQYLDSETGTWHNGFRDYDASTGRYLQSDPIGLSGGFNTYAYVGGNPSRYTDLMGLEFSEGRIAVEAGIGIASVALIGAGVLVGAPVLIVVGIVVAVVDGAVVGYEAIESYKESKEKNQQTEDEALGDEAMPRPKAPANSGGGGGGGGGGVGPRPPITIIVPIGIGSGGGTGGIVTVGPVTPVRPKRK
jgi:RHS repeat-associated protein